MGIEQSPMRESRWVAIPGYVAIIVGLVAIVGDFLMTLSYFDLLRIQDRVILDPCALPALGFFAGLIGIGKRTEGMPGGVRCGRLSRIGLYLLVAHMFFLAVAIYVWRKDNPGPY